MSGPTDFTTSSVSITVQNRQGQPVPGAQVRAWHKQWGHFQPWERKNTKAAGTDGRVVLSMMAGDWVVQAAAPGLFVHARVTIDATTAAAGIVLKPTDALRLQLDATLAGADIYFFVRGFSPALPPMPVGTVPADAVVQYSLQPASSELCALAIAKVKDQPNAWAVFERTVSGRWFFLPGPVERLIGRRVPVELAPNAAKLLQFHLVARSFSPPSFQVTALANLQAGATGNDQGLDSQVDNLPGTRPFPGSSPILTARLLLPGYSMVDWPASDGGSFAPVLASTAGIIDVHLESGVAGFDVSLAVGDWNYRYYPDYQSVSAVQASLPPGGPTGSKAAHWQTANGTTVVIPRNSVQFGGVHTIAPHPDSEDSNSTATWLRVTDHFGHHVRQVQQKGVPVKQPVTGLTFKNAAGQTLFPQDANDSLFSPGSEPFFFHCQRLNPATSKIDPWKIGTDAVLWSGSIDLGPLGALTLAGDPHAPGAAYQSIVCASNTHFEVRAPAGMEARAESILVALTAARAAFNDIWGYAPPKHTVRLVPIIPGAVGITSGTMTQVRLFDMLLAAPQTWNPASEFERICDHEFFHVVQAASASGGKRNFYEVGWYGESLPQVAYGRAFLRSYGKNVATADRSCYVTEFMKRQASQPSNAGWGREVIWEEVILRSGESAHHDAAHLIADSTWSGLAKTASDSQKIAGVLGAYLKVTGINFGYVARLAGDVATDAEIQQAADHL